jgi:hypothetical protein
VSSPNPGISAAGEAAGRTALNPSTGPAAIGGMRESEPEPQPPVQQRTHTPAYKRVRSAEEEQLTTAVTDIMRLAMALRALSLDPDLEEVDASEEWGRPGDGPYAASGGTPGPAYDPSPTNRPHGLGATGGVTPGVGGYAAVPVASTDTHRQAASHYRS